MQSKMRKVTLALPIHSAKRVEKFAKAKGMSVQDALIFCLRKVSEPAAERPTLRVFFERWRLAHRIK